MTDHLNGATDCDKCRECPLLPAVALIDMNKHADAEDGNEDGVGCKVWLVLKDAPFDAARFEVAFSPASLVRSVGRHCL